MLTTMAQTAKDFIRKRTLDDVFPPLVNYLRKLQVRNNKRNKVCGGNEITEIVWESFSALRIEIVLAFAKMRAKPLVRK